MAIEPEGLASEDLSRRRVTEFLDEFAAKGTTHRTVASLLGVPVQYLSDFKQGRRRLSESMARRFEVTLGVHGLWLLGQSDVREVQQPEKLPAPLEGGIVRLRVFPHPIEGDPQYHPKWDGTFVEIIGAAASTVRVSKLPYVLRFGADDARNRLAHGDMLLMSQATLPLVADMESIIQVIRHGRGMYLARRKGGTWIRLASAHQTPITEPCTVHGHAMGIVWGSLT